MERECDECRGVHLCPMCELPSYLTTETCEQCNGSGRYWIDEDGVEYLTPDYGLEEETCPVCNGTGVIERNDYD